MKLVSRYRGRLMVIPAGRKAAVGPVTLWTHLGERTPVDESLHGSSQGGMFLLLPVAAGEDDVLAAVGRALTALGTRSRESDDGSVTPGSALDLVRDSHTVLSFLGALSGRGRDTRPTAEDKLPARAAPQTWPRPARPVPDCTSMNMVNALTKPCGWPARRYGRAHEEWPEAAPMG